MTEFEIIYFMWMFTTVILVWILPSKWQIDFLAVTTLIFLAIFSPWSGLCLFSVSLLVYASITVFPRKQPALIGVSLMVISFGFFFYKWVGAGTANAVSTLPVMLGLSYYTCRHIHVLIEAYKGGIGPMSLRQYLHYQLFLPVLVAGPIHRYQNFLRQCERRRWDSTNITGGLERVCYGYVKVVVIGNYLINLKGGIFLQQYAGESFLGMFLLSAKSWLYLYAAFSGYTDIALGFSLMLGFHIEENFNHPFRALNLIDFWQRWHITLSQWCKDYVFGPVQAVTRNQLLGVIAAMTVMGLWHEFSLYYLIWGFYHALGIAMLRLYQSRDMPQYFSFLPVRFQNTMSRTATFSWLIAGKPVITSVLSLTGMG